MRPELVWFIMIYVYSKKVTIINLLKEESMVKFTVSFPGCYRYHDKVRIRAKILELEKRIKMF